MNLAHSNRFQNYAVFDLLSHYHTEASLSDFPYDLLHRRDEVGIDEAGVARPSPVSQMPDRLANEYVVLAGHDGSASGADPDR